MWAFMFLLSIFMATMMILSLPHHYDYQRVEQQGNLVDVEVVRGSEFRFGKRTTYELHFIYEGRERSTQVSQDYLVNVRGLRSTKLLHSPDYPDIFLQPSQSEDWEIASGYLLIVFFVFMTGYSFINLLKDE